MKKILITGVLGFIFSNFIEWAIDKYPEYTFIGIDKGIASYSLKSIFKHPRYRFYLGDVADQVFINNVFKIENPDFVIHGAAESFVDDSIRDIKPFLHSNVLGTSCMIEASLIYNIEKFLYISTDEVYGQLQIGEKSWDENFVTSPRNPYSSSKLCGELIVKSAHETHGLQYLITRSSNNYGKIQPPRNLVPKIITQTINNKKIPIHGSGKNFREWLYVEDNCSAIMKVLESGAPNSIYNIGSGVEMTNLEMVSKICNILGKEPQIDFIADRKGHDFRYSVDCSRIKQLGWYPKYNINDALEKTVDWYLHNINYYE
jgi:dTDP-glucose 4,6-dehydratase